jgi:hypothetical protein
MLKISSPLYTAVFVYEALKSLAVWPTSLPIAKGEAIRNEDKIHFKAVGK